MTTAQGAWLCRLRVVGPQGRADLAVPASTTIATLIPVLLRHTSTDPRAPGPWALQRLGEVPLDPDGTPESLDLLEGEELYLRPAAEVMPEPDFDDVADGLATMVRRRPDHWRVEFNRPLFLGLSVVVLLATAWILVAARSPIAVPAAAVLSATLIAATLVIAHHRGDRGLAVLLGGAACGFGGLAGGVAFDGGAALLRPDPSSVLVAGATMAAGALVVLVARQWRFPAVPVAPFGVLLVAGLALAAALWCHVVEGFPPVEVESVAAVVFLAATLSGPRVAIRLARLRGPQLPRSAAELQVDIEPAKAEEVRAATVAADRYLDIVTVSAALVIAATGLLLLPAAGWAPRAFTGVLALATVLCARGYHGAWQRASLALAGSIGLLGLVTVVSRDLLVPALVVLAGTVVVLVQAAVRPANRRPAPTWGHFANILEWLSAAALIPIVLQLLHVYAWARGLGG